MEIFRIGCIFSPVLFAFNSLFVFYTKSVIYIDQNDEKHRGWNAIKPHGAE